MMIKTTAYVIGARYYDIPDENTGEIKRYTSLFIIQSAEPFHDRIGQESGKLRGASSKLVDDLKAYRLPCELELEVELRTNAKGEAKPTVHRIIGEAQRAEQTKKAA